MKQSFVVLLMLAISNSTFAADFTDLFGIVPGEPVPYLRGEFGPSPNNMYEKPVPSKELAAYFQYLQVMVLPPDTVAYFYLITHVLQP